MERQARALAGMHRRAALQIWQREVGLAIAAVVGPEEREEGRVLHYRHELAIAPGPAFRREVEWKNPDFSDERVCHKTLGVGSGLMRLDHGWGKSPKSEMMKLTHRYGWKFVCGWDPPVGAIASELSCTVGVPERKN